jgi:hypothetical protein
MVRPWIKRLGLWAGPTLLLILLWQVWDRYEDRHLQQQIRRIQAGAPSVTVSTEKWGAGRFYLSAYVLSGFGDAFRDVALARQTIANGGPLSDGTRVELGELARRFDPAVRLVDEAADLPLGSMTEVAYFAQSVIYRQVDNAYSLVMLTQLLDGRTQEPPVAIISRARMLRAYDSAPTWLTALNKAATAEVIASDLGIVSGTIELPPNRSHAIDGALAGIFRPDELEGTIRAQALSQNLAFSQMLKRPSDYSRFGLASRPLLRAQEATVMDALARCIEIARRPLPSRILDMQKIEPTHMLGEQVWISTPAGGVEMCRRMSLAYARGLAAVRAARVALSIERYRLTHVEWPASLSMIDVDVQAAEFLDPFTAKPLRYLRQPEGFAVYSVGPDLHDDNGAVTPAARAPAALSPPQPSDVGVSVRRLRARSR